MDKFDFGGISIPVENNHQDIRRAREFSKDNSPKEITKNLISHLSSFYKENKPLSPENRGKLNTLLIGLAVTLLSSDMNNQGPEKKPDLKTTSDTAHSFKLESEEIPTPAIQETKIKLSPIEIKNEPPSKIEKTNVSLKSPDKNAADASMERVINIAEEVLLNAEKLSQDQKRFPKKLFSEKFLTALKIQESGFEIDAESGKGAVGLMQVMPRAILEVIRYLNKLERLGVVSSNLPSEDQITKEHIEKISNLIKTNGAYGEAFGKIYLIDLFYNFDIGKKEYASGKITEAHKKILATYNWSPDDFKKYENNEKMWPNQSTEYYQKIFRYMDTIDNIQAQMKQMKILTDVFDLSPFLALEIKKYERELGEKNPDFEERIESVMMDYLITIKEMEEIREEPLTPEEVKKIIKNFNPEAYRNYLAKR